MHRVAFRVYIILTYQKKEISVWPEIHILWFDNVKMSQSHPFPLICLTKELYTRPLVLTPQQIGFTHRKKKQLLNVAQALLFYINMPKWFWSDAVLTTCYLINKMPSTVLDGASPSFYPISSSSYFHSPPKVFGYVCYNHNFVQGFDKLGLHSMYFLVIHWRFLMSLMANLDCLLYQLGSKNTFHRGDPPEEVYMGNHMDWLLKEY